MGTDRETDRETDSPSAAVEEPSPSIADDLRQAETARAVLSGVAEVCAAQEAAIRLSAEIADLTLRYVEAVFLAIESAQRSILPRVR